MKLYSLNKVKKKKGFFKYREEDKFVFVSFGNNRVYYLSEDGIEPIDEDLWRKDKFFKIKRKIEIVF